MGCGSKRSATPLWSQGAGLNQQKRRRRFALPPHSKYFQDAPTFLHMVIALSMALVLTGCKSTPRTPSNRLASVVITNRSPDEIEAATRIIFEKHAYELLRRRDGDPLVFEKQGTFMNGLFYGDWYSGGVWERVRVYHIDMEPGATLLDCDAYMVQEHDDPFFQSERKPYKSRRHVYQKILEEVARELGQK